MSPGAAGSSDGYLLDNGQEEGYEDADTRPLPDVLEELRSGLQADPRPRKAAGHVRAVERDGQRPLAG